MPYSSPMGHVDSRLSGPVSPCLHVAAPVLRAVPRTQGKKIKKYFSRVGGGILQGYSLRTQSTHRYASSDPE